MTRVLVLIAGLGAVLLVTGILACGSGGSSGGSSVTVGAPVKGSFGTSLPTDESDKPYMDYALNISKAGTYQIDLVSKNTGEYDPLVTLRQGANEIGRDDDGGGSLQARLSKELQPGSYTVRVTRFGSGQIASAVDFTLTVGGGAASQTKAAETPETPSPAKKAAANEPWRTGPFKAPADTPCPDGWWLFVRSKSVDNTLLSGSISNGYARIRDEGGLHLVFANYDLPTDPSKLQWASPREDGHVRAAFVVEAANKAPIKVGTYVMGDEAAKLRLLEPGVGYDFPGGTGGIGWSDKAGPNVEITHVDDEKICGRVAIDDTYSAVIGAFSIKRLPAKSAQ